MRDEAATLAPGEPAPANGARPLRIVFAGYRSHPHVGGQGVYLREATRALVDLGHHVDVVSGPPYPDLDARVRLFTLPSLDLFTQKNALTAFRPGFLARWPDLAEWWLHNTGAFGEPYAFGHRLKHWLGECGETYDVLHDNQGLSRSLLDIHSTGLTTVATLHHPISIDLDLALREEPSMLGRALLRRWHSFVATQARVARSLPGLVTVSEASKAAAVRDFGVDAERIAVAYNGVDHDTFRPCPDLERDPRLVVATASSDTPLKGLRVLLEAFAAVASQHGEARLVVVGRLRDGPAKDVLERARLGDRVTFRNALSSEDMAALYAKASFAVAPSRFEGFGLPAAEAMACATPVVATNGGGLPEVVGEAGVIVPAGDVSALANAMSALIGDPAERDRLGAAACKRARERFSWRAHAHAILDLYAAAGVHVDHRP